MNHRRYYKKGRFMVVHLSAFFFILMHAGNSYSRPDMTPLGPNIADKGSSFYHFSVSKFDSVDGKRHYKVWTGIPDKTPPASGSPVLYMLDGNAVMDRLSDELLKKLSERTPPVLIVIGYQTALPFESSARAYDYTPSVKENNTQNQATRRYDRQGGGSLIFRHLLEDTIALQAEKNLNINPAKRGLWGHSYGGLFVMDSYLSSSFFTRYYSASPSLELDNFALLKKLTMINKKEFDNKQLYLMEGDGDPKKNGEDKTPDVLGLTRKAVSTLHSEGVSATYWLYPGFTHGQMFTASFQSALLQVAASD